MAKRALLIAAETYGLTGCERDAALMGDVLGRRGFEVELLQGERATRAGMVGALGALVAATAPGDAVVVYYSGHGGRMPHPDWAARQAAGRAAHIQFLVPTDIGESTPDDFRGLLAEELTEWQWRLTDATRNVTTILDCCHSAFMARDLDLTPKAVAKAFPVEGITRRLAALPPERAGADSNPSAVRIVACQPEQSAFERTSDRGGRHGALTDFLATALDDVGDRRVTWATVGDVVRRRVQAVVPQQRPDVEGPARRLPFSEEERAGAGSLPVAVGGGGAASIEGAALLGVSAGDTFVLVAPDTGAAVGRAVVATIDGDGHARLAVTRAAGVIAVPVPCDAVPVAVALPPVLVRIDVPPPGGDELRSLVDASPHLAVDPVGPVAVRFAAGLVVEDASGRRISRTTWSDDDAGRRAVVARLEQRVRADRLRSIASGTGAAALDRTVVVELATHAGGVTSVRRSSGERLRVGDRVTVTARNLGTGPAWVWLFDIGVDDEVTLLTPSSGQRLERAGTAGGDVVLFGRKEPRPLAWGNVPDDGPWPEQLLVIVADRQQDLAPLATVRRGFGGTPLDLLLDEVRSGTRSAPVDGDGTPLRYRVDRIEFLLEPGAGG